MKKGNTKEITERLLKRAKKTNFDFGKNWMEEIDTLQ
jgi:hypothetical protein